MKEINFRKYLRNLRVFSLWISKSVLKETKRNLKQFPTSISRIPYYFGLWTIMTKNAFMVVLAQKKVFLIFLMGKIIRFVFFIVFLVFLVKGSGSLAGYSVNEVIFFFLTFNLIDVLSQFLFREVYRFRPLVVSGDLDLIMTKPYKTLFRVLMGGSDVIDFVTIPPLIVATIYVGMQIHTTLIGVIYYLSLVINALIIATAFHIAVLGIGILTLEVDHIIWIYRDLAKLGKFPIDIYKQPLQMMLTYIIPIGLMMSIPVKAMLGLISFWGVVASLILGLFLLTLSLKLWNFSVLKYKSASS